MPIYTFKCTECFKVFDVITFDSSLKEHKCPDCVDSQGVRIPTCGSFVIKGYSEKNGYSKKE